MQIYIYLGGGLILYWTITPDMGLSWSIVGILSDSPMEILLCQNANSFLVKGEIKCPLPLLSGEILFGFLNLCMPCVHCHSLSEFPCTLFLLYLEDTVSLKSLTISVSYNLSSSSST